MLNAAVVGLGWWGRTVTDRLSQSGEIRVTRAVDIYPDRHQDYAQRWGIPVGPSYEEAVADPGVDAVILCTPNSLHTAQVAYAARAGKHVFCEKPLALRRAEAEASVAVCRENGVTLGIGHERRFEPAMQELERMVKAGELGTLMHAEASFSHDKLINVPEGDWRRRSDESPAAGMTAMGIHLSDAYVNLFGPASAVMAMTAKRVLPGDNGDVISAIVRFESGPIGYLNANLYTPHYLQFRVFGTKAWVEVVNETHPDTPGPATLTLHVTGEAPRSTRFEWADSVRANFELFARAAQGQAEYVFTDEQKIGNIAILEAIVRSAEEGRAIRP